MTTTPYRVLVTGTRGWRDGIAVGDALRGLQRLAGRPMLLVHGGCPDSPDMLADSWARTLGWLGPEVHRAEWNGPAGRGAGFARNAEMVKLGADVCLAFLGRCVAPRCAKRLPHDSHGATHCANLAESYGITTVRYLPGVARDLEVLVRP